MAKMSLGCRFVPKEKEIFTYLHNKVHDIQHPNVKLDLIQELDLYQSCPSDHPGLSKKEHTYIFTKRVASRRSSRFSDRNTKDRKGFWKTNPGIKEFKQGTRTTLTYYLKGGNEKGMDKRTDWLMHEYALRPADPKMKVNELMVLCRIIDRKPKDEETDTEQESDSSTKDGRGRDKSGVKLMIESSQEYQQKNTAAPANKENVCINLCSDDDESNQGYDQLNNSIPAKETCLNLIETIDESHQSYDQHKNTTSAAEKDLDLSLQL